MNVVIFKVKEENLFLYPELTTEEKVGLELNGSIVTYKSNEQELAIIQFFDANQVNIIDTISAKAIISGTKETQGHVEQIALSEEVHEQFQRDQ